MLICYCKIRVILLKHILVIRISQTRLFITLQCYKTSPFQVVHSENAIKYHEIPKKKINRDIYLRCYSNLRFYIPLYSCTV